MNFARADSDPWIRMFEPRPDAAVRLFCFPYAGGGASMYLSWARSMPAAVEVCPIQLPGREERFADAHFRQLEPLKSAVLEHLEPCLDKPFLLFGHSMGAIIAYEIAHALSSQGRPPAHLIVSGQRAPHIPLSRPMSYHLPEAAFRERLRELKGTPEQVL